MLPPEVARLIDEQHKPRHDMTPSTRQRPLELIARVNVVCGFAIAGDGGVLDWNIARDVFM